MDDVPQDPMGQDFLASVDALVKPNVVPLRSAEGGGQKDATATAPPLLVAYTAPDLLSLDIPEPPCLVEPWLHEQSLAMIHGYRGLGKSWLAATVAVMAARGGETLGWRSDGGSRVLLIDGEMPLRLLQSRIRSAARLVMPTGGRSGGSLDKLRILAADGQEAGIPSLSSEQGQAAVEPLVAESDLVIIDNLTTLARSTTGADDNSVESWAPMQDWLLSQRRKKKTCVIVHHSGKGGEQRGTSAKEDVQDIVIGLRQPKTTAAEDGLSAELRFDKARSIWGDATAPMDIRLAMGSDGLVEWQWGSADDRDDRINEAITMRSAGKSFQGIANELGVSKSTIIRWCR